MQFADLYLNEDTRLFGSKTYKVADNEIKSIPIPNQIDGWEDLDYECE
jgi:hypothetical protein